MQSFSKKIANYIRKKFVIEGNKHGCPRILEKTVANVMRPKFVQAVLPEAKILHIIRDGRAVAASAIKCWSTQQPPSYFLSKVQTVPITSLPSVAFNFFYNKIVANQQKKNYHHTWGARWPGIDKDVMDLPLAQLCARQWVRQVEIALSQKSSLSTGSYMEVRYEKLVQNPNHYFEKIRRFFELPKDESFQTWVDTNIDSRKFEKWQKDFSKNQLDLVLKEALPLLEELGYL